LRRVVYNLRTSLRQVGFDDLAQMIDGSHPHHYGLIVRPDMEKTAQQQLNQFSTDSSIGF